MENFINLHTHSDYSNFRLRDSINNIKDLTLSITISKKNSVL